MSSYLQSGVDRALPGKIGGRGGICHATVSELRAAHPVTTSNHHSKYLEVQLGGRGACVLTA